MPIPAPDVISCGRALRGGVVPVLLGLFLAVRPLAEAGAAMAAPVMPLRPPAVPLVAHDPYFSIWSPADRLTEADTVHWTGRPHRLTGLVRIDGQGFRVLGREPATLPALAQTGVEVLPTRTLATFVGGGVRLTLTFVTPALPDDLSVCSRPVTYLTWTAQAIDGGTHRVEVYLDVSPEIAVDRPDQAVTARVLDVDGLDVLAVGSVEQPVLRRKGDDLRIDWGTFYLAAPGWPEPGGVDPADLGAGTVADPQRGAAGVSGGGDRTRRQVALLGGREEARLAWAWRGSLVAPVAPGTFVPADPVSPVLAFHGALGRVGSSPVTRAILLAYDDVVSIRYFGENLRPYWRRGGDDAAVLLRAAAAESAALLRRCEALDALLMADLRRLGGERYAQLCALAYRQTFAGNKIVADSRGQPMMFPKENFSNGCIGTVDVLFPQAPFFLALSPALTKAMLVPVLEYAASPRWPYGYAPHDLGTYPQATGQVYGMGGTDGDRMPVEESGNMLIMMAALARVEGDAEFARPYLPMLGRWAEYLAREGLDPTNQLCSADMFGHLPRVANLALKAILGLGGYAQICELSGEPEAARRFMDLAREGAARWQELARDEGRTRLAFHLPGSWGMKHNLIWDRVLGLTLFPEAIGDAEIAWYLKVQNRYGLPVDHRTATSLIDWAMWSIAPARRAEDFQALLEPLWRYVHETPSRVPLSDWFITTNAVRQGFQARPVVGGLFIKMVSDSPTWEAWARRGANVRGAWAPLPVPVPVRDVVPTAARSPGVWRYTFETPARDWSQPGFDDSAWATGPAGFGTRGTPGAILGTEWNTARIWLRREFVLPDRPLRNPRFLLLYDEDPRVYLNGVLAAERTGWATSYEEADLNPAALATLRPGTNLLAVSASQTYGGQSIDVGLVEDDVDAEVRE